jgi:hypothetical protein
MFIGIALLALAGTAQSRAGVSLNISLGDGFGYGGSRVYEPVTPYCPPAPPVYVAPPTPVYVVPQERCYIPRYEYRRPARWHDRNHFDHFHR